jgi:hypothetical protein
MSANLRRKVVDVDDVLQRESAGALDGVFQFTYVARPVIAQDAFERCRRIAGNGPVHLMSDSVQEHLGETLEVLRPVPKWGHDKFGRTKFFGTPDLVRYLSSRGVPTWTHTLDV